MTAGKELKIQLYNDESDEWETIGVTTCKPISDLEGEWEEYIKTHSKPWSIDLEIVDLDWDETWLVAYMGRMYANEYRN